MDVQMSAVFLTENDEPDLRKVVNFVYLNLSGKMPCSITKKNINAITPYSFLTEVSHTQIYISIYVYL